MNNKRPNWQENDNDILAQFPDSPARELLAFREEPAPTLRKRVLSIPQDEPTGKKGFRWSFGSGLLNRLAGAVVLAALVVVLGLWVFSLASSNRPDSVQPDAAAPVSTIRPTATSTRDLSFLSPSNIITATPTETGGCPTTPFLAGNPDVDELGQGSYFINENRTIWASRPRGWQTGGERVLWVKPEGSELKITGRLLYPVFPENTPSLDASVSCCNSDSFQITALNFPMPGCWEITAEAGGEQLQFITEVGATFAESVVTGLTLLDYQFSSTTMSAGDLLTITLHWKAGEADAQDMGIFFHLVDSNNIPMIQLDETIPANIWISQNITTTHTLSITDYPDTYTLVIGLYDSETLARIRFYYNDELALNGAITIPITLEVMAE